jgi:hypothetical protein
MDRPDAITAKTPSSGGGSRLDYEPTDQEWAMALDRMALSGVTSESLAAEKAQLAQETASRQSTRAADDAEFNRRSAEREEKAQRDFDEGNRRNAELKASRVTENWQGQRINPARGFNMGSTSEMVRTRRGGMREKTTDNPTSNLTYAEKDKDGNQYRPKGWTQEDEEASARASETGSRLERIMRYTPFGDRILGPQVGKQIARIGKMKSSASPPPAAKPKKRRT